MPRRRPTTVDQPALLRALLVELRALETLRMRDSAQVVRRRRLERAIFRVIARIQSAVSEDTL